MKFIAKGNCVLGMRGLFVGATGTGKTIVVEAIAYGCGMF